MLLVLILTIALVGCGNENWGFGSYTFTHVYIIGAGEGHCATIESWHDNEMGVELHTTEFGNIYCSEGTYFLFGSEENCPFCGGK
jgi:hypothetical protein